MRVAPDLLIRRARLVPVATPGARAVTGSDRGPVDVLVRGGRVVSVDPAGSRPVTTESVDAGGRPLIPGLWDKHVHMTEWARSSRRLDLGGAASPDEVVQRVAEHIATLPADDLDGVVVGWGHRSAAWSRPATVAELDAVSGAHPLVLMSGDGHSGWLNTSALQRLGAGPRTTALDENEWFALVRRLPGLTEAEPLDEALSRTIRAAHECGVVGIVDMDFVAANGAWPTRLTPPLRVRTSVYAERLDEVLRAGRRTGRPWEGGAGLITMGSLKIISDGSLGTRTAYCCEPYPEALRNPDHPRGKANVDAAQLVRLMSTAHAHGLTVALHAIGDAAVSGGLDAFEASGARGSIEHAQLMRPEDVGRMARLGLTASVQPAHLIDDRDITGRCWPGREDRCFPLRDLLDAGVPLAMGSDAPVAPLDPWGAMAAAVHRGHTQDDAWTPEQSITAAEALGCSTDGWGTVAPGHPADLALLDDDPLPESGDTADAATGLRARRAVLTMVAGTVVHSALGGTVEAVAGLPAPFSPG